MVHGARPLAGLSVLLVEDEFFIADDLARLFEASGAEVVGPAGRVEEALELIANAPRIDGAVVDINLHGEMAYPVADALRKRGVPLVFATGYDQAAIPAAYAAVIRCEKPVDPAKVATALFG